MDEWASSFITRVMDAGVTLHMIAKYVYNVNLILAGLALGTRWVDRALVHSMQLEAEDIEKKRSVEDVTMTCMRVAAESITSWLKFTHNSPELNTSRTVPIPDLQVWVRHQDPGLWADLLAWELYEKPIASSKLMRALSAYTWRNKSVTMTMELHRRLINSSRQLTLRAKSEILKKYVDKLRISG